MFHYMFHIGSGRHCLKFQIAYAGDVEDDEDEDEDEDYLVNEGI